jgi:hypothetical protein
MTYQSSSCVGPTREPEHTYLVVILVVGSQKFVAVDDLINIQHAAKERDMTQALHGRRDTKPCKRRGIWRSNVQRAAPENEGVRKASENW